MTDAEKIAALKQELAWTIAEGGDCTELFAQIAAAEGHAGLDDR
jgi:hypothetical protein